jgi:hypothetical protein
MMSKLDRTRVEAEQTRVVADTTSDPFSAETDRSPAPPESEPKLDTSLRSLDEATNLHIGQAGVQVGNAAIAPDDGFGAGATPEPLVDKLGDDGFPHGRRALVEELGSDMYAKEEFIGDEVVFAREDLGGDEVVWAKEDLGGDEVALATQELIGGEFDFL